MAWEQKKRYFVAHCSSEPPARLCRVLRIGRRTGYNWLARFKAGGLEELLTDDPGGRPRKNIPQDVQNAVLALREEQGWNEKKIRQELKETGVTYHAIRQVLAQANVLGVAPQRRRRTFRKFERPLPNHLWQADFTLLDDATWMFALLDDHSRYLVDAEEFENPTTENALFVCRRAVRRHGSPYQLMTDHGVQFWNNNRESPNNFGPTLDALGVEHILAGVKRPQTNGKIERWFGQYKDEIPRFPGLTEYVYHYNFCRPHGGIDYQKPYERYFAFKL